MGVNLWVKGSPSFPMPPRRLGMTHDCPTPTPVALWPIADKAVPVRHFYPRERFCVHPRLRAYDAVEEKEVSAHRVNFVVREGLRSIERHGPADIVEQRGRVGPIAPDGLYRFLRAQRAYPSHEGIGGSLYTLHPVTTGREGKQKQKIDSGLEREKRLWFMVPFASFAPSR